MGLSRDVERARLGYHVWPLEGVKFNSCFLWFLLNISGTLHVRDLKFLSQTHLDGMQLLFSKHFIILCIVWP